MIRDVLFAIRDARCGMRDTRSQMPDSRYGIRICDMGMLTGVHYDFK
jgi:hypothetical protein